MQEVTVAGSVTAISDKIMRLMRSMVYYALKVQPGRELSVDELSLYINQNAAAGAVHSGVVELALQELLCQGQVRREGARWCLHGATA